MLKQPENRDLSSMAPDSITPQTSYSSADFSDREYGSHTGDSFNGFDHQEAYHVNNADLTDMLNHEPAFDTYQKRLDTFARWPAYSPVLPSALAAAGFFYTGIDDRVVCFKCGLHLLRWTAEDDPWIEHKRCRPACLFVKECENEVTCRPVEASSSVQEPSQPSFTPAFPRYGDRMYHAEQHGGARDHPEELVYPERPQYATQGGGEGGVYGNQEQPYPVDTQTGFQPVYYPAGTQEFRGVDPRFVEYTGHEQTGTDRNKHLVVRQGANQVHIVGSSVYRLTPEDKLYIHGGGQGYPPQVRSERELQPIYPGAHQTSRLPSMETSVTGSHPAPRESSQYSSQVQMPSRTRFPQSTVSYPPSNPGPFGNHAGYQYPSEKSSQGENARTLQEGSSNVKHMMQPFREGDQIEYGRDTLHETRASMPSYEAERRASREDQLLQENCYNPQQYPGTNSERDLTGTRPQPTQDRSRRQTPPGRMTQGTRRPSPAFMPAFPVKDPSLQTAQRPLIRQEEARHVTSSSDLSNEHHRLTTFVDWPHDHHIRAWDLSAAGFYYLGTGDSVKCYKCSVMLHNWDPTDTPWGEHQKWSPICPLVLDHNSSRQHVQRQNTAPEQRVTSVEEDRQRRRLDQGPTDRQVPYRSGNPARPVYGTWEGSEQYPAGKVSNGSTPRNPSTEEQRSPWYTQPMTTSSEEVHMTSGCATAHTEESGLRRSSETPQGPRSCSPRGSTAIEFDLEKLAEMGFTQREIQDVIAFQIESTGSTFNTFTELVSALLERQQARSPGCESFPQPTTQEDERSPFPPRLEIPTGVPAGTASQRENEDFRERNCQSAVTSPTTLRPDRPSLRRTLSEPASRSSESEESLEEKLERMQEERTCKVCMDAEVGVVFLPCGHFSCCAGCAKDMDLCPMCRSPIHEMIRTYLS